MTLITVLLPTILRGVPDFYNRWRPTPGWTPSVAMMLTSPEGWRRMWSRGASFRWTTCWAAHGELGLIYSLPSGKVSVVVLCYSINLIY